MTAIRELKATINCMLTENQKHLIKFHRNNIINLDLEDENKFNTANLPNFTKSNRTTPKGQLSDHISKLVKAYEGEELTDTGKL